MLYGCETWCLGQIEIGIVRKTERAMVRSVWSKISGQEVDKTSNADVGHE